MNAVSTLPGLSVELDGAPLASDDAQALGQVRVQQRLSLPTLCELTFFDPHGALAKAARPLPGMSLRLGIEGAPVTLFSGEITAAEYSYGPSGGRQVRVRGYDLLHRLRKRQPVRAHVELTLEELARELVEDTGLKVQAVEPGPLWHKLVQWRQSDLELLGEVAERCGLYFTARDETLHIISLEGLGQPVPLALGSSLREVRVDVNTDPACRSVETLGWDPWRAEQHRGDAKKPRVGRRVDIDALPSHVGASGERTLADETVQSDDQATALAQSELDRRVAGEVTLWGVAEGDPRLQPGALIQVEGVAPALAGRHVLTSVRHTLDRHTGFLSEIDTAPPPALRRAKGTLSTVGVVTDVEDPESLGRIRVSLPNYGDIESDWLEVLSPGAGKDKGLVTLPDRDDRVLVLLSDRDPAQGIVLGGLYGVQGPPDAGVEGSAVRRYTFVTPGGQRLRLDDEEQTVRLENSGGSYLQATPGRARIANSDGSYVELTRSRLRIHANADLEIEAPGKSVTIRGASIDFERA